MEIPRSSLWRSQFFKMEVNKQIVAYIRNKIIASKTGATQTEEDEIYAFALENELAVNFDTSLEFYLGYKLSKEDVIEFWNEVLLSLLIKEKKDYKSTQPYFPEIIPVRREIPGYRKKILRIINLTELKKIINKDRVNQLSHFDFSVLQIDENSISNQYLYGVLAKCCYGVGPELKIQHKNFKREERRLVMEGVEMLWNKGIRVEPNDINLDLWNKLRLAVHPSDYKTFPGGIQFFEEIEKMIKNRETKKTPPPPKFRGIMEKAYKEGTEFEALEEYLDNPELKVKDLIETLKDLETCPRISRYKKFTKSSTCVCEVGKQEIDQGEHDMVDSIKLQLKVNLLKLAGKREDKPKKRIPEYFYQRSVSDLLKPIPTKIIKVGNNPLVIYLSPASFLRLGTSDNVSGIMGWRRDLFNDKNCIIYIRPKSKILVSPAINTYKESVLVKIGKVKPIEFKLDKIETSSIFAFLYNGEKKELVWLGESTKQYYAGYPEKIGNWDEVVDYFVKRIPTVSLGELAESMFSKDDNAELLTLEELRNETGIG